MRPIAYDLVRLFLGPLFMTPRGIDRVDLALARHIFADPDTANLGILPTFWGMRAYRAADVRRLLAHVEHIWAESAATGEDPAQEPQIRGLLQAMRQRPASPSAPDPTQPSPPASPLALPPAQRLKRPHLKLRHQILRMIQSLMATGMPLGRSARAHVPEGAIYLNSGQLGLVVPSFFRWLESRPDLTCAMMLHDVIPLEYPHLCRPGQFDHHTSMVRTAARHADCMIYTTGYARDSVNAVLAEHGGTDLPCLVRGLPLPDAFAQTATGVPALARNRYFVVVSTIEPRKNHDLLLRVWARLVARMGGEAPHLVIVGSRGFNGDRIMAPLESRPALRAHVHEVAGLSSPALASLTLNAAAMLSPTLAEGFGMPVMEANAMGVPTIASDIAAHREVANDTTTLLPGDDEEAWLHAIARTPQTPLRQRPRVVPAMTEAAYCSDLVAYVKGVAAARRQGGAAMGVSR